MNKVDFFKKEYTYIKDKRLLDNLQMLVNLLPDYFFTIPASSTGKYHPSFAEGEGGLVRHTKVAARIAHELLQNNTIGNIFNDNEKDLIIMALILHDGLKHGLEKKEYTMFEHSLIMGQFIKNNKEKLTLNDEEIGLLTSMIESHMGQWNTNQYSDVVLPVPTNRYQKFVHMCDYLGSRKFINVEFQNNDIID